MGFVEVQAAGAPPAPPTAAYPRDSQLWSDAATWGSGRPENGAATIPAGKTVVLDCDIELSSLTIEGTLIIAERDTSIRAGWIIVRDAGRLEAGSAEHPFRSHLTITLCHGTDASGHRALDSKFLAALNGGTIELHGEARTSWVPLGSTVAPGHNTLFLAQPVDWRANERIAIASGQEHSLVEERTITHVGPDCMTVTLDRPVAHRHNGKHAAVRHVLPGSLAKVALLERNIVVQGCGESASDGQGGYCMIAPTLTPGDSSTRCSTARFSGVEFRRMGQFNRAGRYPLHWLDNGDTTGSEVVGCLVQESYQRGIVAVGSRRVRISGNVVMKPCGHGFIVEDEDNSPQLVSTNLAVRPRVARFADIKMRSYCEHRPRAFWIVHSTPARPAPH